MYAFLCILYAALMAYAITECLSHRIPVGGKRYVGAIIFLFLIKLL